MRLIAANWKMNKSIKEADSFMSDFRKLLKEGNAEVALCPPFTILHHLKSLIKNTRIKLGAQDMHFEDKGAFTGEISPLMIKEAGCEYVILGHSERRQYFSESNELINKKIKAALRHKLKPILCVGETLGQRENDETMAIIKSQLEGCLKDINEKEIKNITVAYEPVWAIGTGKNATPEQAQEVHAYMRRLLADNYGNDIAGKLKKIYGGSVKPENAKELLSMKDINGALVGGTSLDAKSFAEVCNLS